MNLDLYKHQIITSESIAMSELELMTSKAKGKKSYKCIYQNCSSSDALAKAWRDPKDGIYKLKCFSCGEIDTVIGAVMKYYGIEYVQAIKEIAGRNGIHIENTICTVEEKRKYAQLKRAKEEKEANIKILDEAQTQAILNNDMEQVVELSKEIEDLEKKPIKILKFPNVDSENKPLKTWENLKALMEHKGIYTVFNEITKNIEIKGLESDDLDDCIMDMHTMSQLNGLRLNIDFIGKSINRIGSQNSYNPVADYLMEQYNNWDGKKGRIKSLCNTLKVSEDFSEDLRDTLLTKWLLNTAKIPFNQGKFNTEGVLILQGEQGLGKTTWIRNIVPPQLEDYLKTGLEIDPSDKDKIYQAIKYWLVELGELDATMKSEQAKLKAFFTERTDEFRRPYARNTSKLHRKTSFFGTVNKREFLKDETGDRRYWVIPCDDIYNELIDYIDIDQLWGEVMHLEENGYKHYLTREDLKELNSSNQDFRAKGKAQISIETAFKWDANENLWKFKTGEEIAQYLNLNTTAGLKEIFNNLGIKQTKGSVKINGKSTRPRGYKVPPFIGEIIDNVEF